MVLVLLIHIKSYDVALIVIISISIENLKCRELETSSQHLMCI